MKLPSPSKHELATICAASFALPHSDFFGERWSTRGTAIHDFLSDVATPGVGREKALVRVAEEFRLDCEVIDLTVLPCQPGMYAPEVTLAYDVETGKVRELGRKLTRAEVYKRLGPNEFPGTPDVIGLTADAVVLPDYKTGHFRYGPSKDIRQLRTYAFMAARAFDRPRAISGIIRIREDGSSYFDKCEFDEFDLATIELEIQEMVAGIRAEQARVAAGEWPRMVEGDHCGRCPAINFCPAKMTLIRQFAATPSTVEVVIEEATEEQLALAYARVTALEVVVERVKKAINARARKSPIQLGNGQVLGEVPEEEVVLAKAKPVLEQLYGALVADAAVEREPKISKASIERALRAHVLKTGMKITHLIRDTLDAIRKAGGIVEWKKIQKHKPKALPPAAAPQGTP